MNMEKMFSRHREKKKRKKDVSYISIEGRKSQNLHESEKVFFCMIDGPKDKISCIHFIWNI